MTRTAIILINLSLILLNLWDAVVLRAEGEDLRAWGCVGLMIGSVGVITVAAGVRERRVYPLVTREQRKALDRVAGVR